MKLFFYITFFFFGISISKSIEIDTVWKTEQPYSIVIEGTFSDSSNILVRHSNILISANPNTGELIKGTERPFDYFFKFAFVNDSIVYLVSKENLIFKYNYDKGVVLDSLRIAENSFGGEVNVNLSPDNTKLYIAQNSFLSVVDLNTFELIAQDFVSGLYLVLALNEPDTVVIACNNGDAGGHRLTFGHIENDTTITKGEFINSNDEEFIDLVRTHKENSIIIQNKQGDFLKYNLNNQSLEFLYKGENTTGMIFFLFKDDMHVLKELGAIINLISNNVTGISGGNACYLIENTQTVLISFQTQPEKINYIQKIKLDFITNVERNFIQLSRDNLFPNPTTDIINIDFTNHESFLGNNLTIYNTQGKIIRSQIISNKIERIDVSDFNSGKYFIKINDSNKEMVGSFIKE